MIPGLYLAHKEVGQSSFDVVRGFKREAFAAGEGKLAVGHGGTLDPFAEGLLLVLAGQATRLMELLHPLPRVQPRVETTLRLCLWLLGLC